MEGFSEIYKAVQEHPGAATTAIFALAWVYERHRNAVLSKALVDLSDAQVKGIANLEVAFRSFRDTVIAALVRR